MRHIRAKKSNRSLRTWVLGSTAGLALVAGGGIVAQAATAGHAHPAKPGTSAPAAPKPVPSTPGEQASSEAPSAVPVPGDANGKPYPKPVPSTPGKQTSPRTAPSAVPVPGDANGKPYPGNTGR
ncbi:hypothetical protein [Streptomyces sp. BV129]|uniref:hypothetical protein n=1 Tax=Streptomyces sp. BV129 TaxID=2849671 RepID=UPI001C2E994F|nr:hypothetical protein [Streptomyces sp. BV129]MBV1949531.1 hypothetical protein [Streptomyces sp. BV129]